MNNSTLKTLNHSAFRLHYHLVLSTKYRKKCLTANILNRMKDIINELMITWRCNLIEFGGESDHVHILFEANPTIRLSDMVRSLKSVTSRKLRNEFSEPLKKYYWKPYFWNRAYAIISVGGRANIETLLQYIKNQDDPRHLRCHALTS